jgi:ribonuclease Y
LNILIIILTLLGGTAAGWLIKWTAANYNIILARKKAVHIIESVKKQARAEAQKMYETGLAQFQNEKQLFEEEMQEMQVSLDEMKNQLAQKTQLVDNRANSLRSLRNMLNNRERRIEEYEAKSAVLREAYHKQLEELTATSREFLRQIEAAHLIDEEKKDAQQIIHKAELEATRSSIVRGTDLIMSTLQRMPASQSIEYAPTTLEIPSHEMISKLMAKDGRYIRLLEHLLNVEIYIEDTPDGFSLSSPDHIKREVAKATIDRLFKDNRMNSNRIEEVYNNVTRQIEETMHKEARAVLYELNIRNLKEEAVKTLGRLLYSFSYGQNNLYHSKEVAIMAGLMAAEIGANKQLAIRAGLLHDIGKAISVDGKAHVELGVELAREWGEDPLVINAIASHHEDVEHESVEAVLVKIADAISGARAGARRETITSYLELVDNIEKIAGDFEGVDKAFAIYAGRELRIMVNSEKINDSRAEGLAQDIAKKIQENVSYPGKIKVTLIREMKISHYTN